MNQENPGKKIMLMGIGVALLIVAVFGATYAFFSYSRTGSNNTITTGTITFNSTNTLINLTNAFPVTATTASGTTTSSANVGIATVTITGSTTYTGGVDYTVKAVDVSSNIGTAAGKLPVKIIVSASNLSGATLLGSGAATLVTENAVIASGNIPSGASGVNGTITIKAFIDDTAILVTDTAVGTTTSGYTNNTVTSGKTVMTTTQWNAAHSTPATFKILVEAVEHTS